MRKRARAVLAVMATAGLLAGGSAADTGATNATNATNAAGATGETVHVMRPNTPDYAKSHGGGGRSSNPNLYYHGGGVELVPNVVLVFWGSQWNGGDPDLEANRLGAFLGAIGTVSGESWSRSTTQYCDSGGAAVGSYTCTASTITVPGSALAATVHDDTSPAPTHPTQSQLAAEAVKIATSATANYDLANTQFVIATASGNNASGFGTQYCAWHSSTTTSTGARVAYTNLPYIPDAGYSCGAGSVHPGDVLDGVTIVEGHEYAESVTDQFPNGGWLDGSGAENGDKCAWKNLADVAFGETTTYPVQPLWSNAVTGCVLAS